MVRLVKGAYWDSEIKRAQERGLDGYPVLHPQGRDRCLLPRLRQAAARGGGRVLSAIRDAQRAYGGGDPGDGRRPPRLGIPAAARHGRGALRRDRRAATSWTAVPGLRAGRQPRGPARLSGAAAAGERRQHLVRQPHRRRARADRRDHRRPGRAAGAAAGQAASAHPAAARPLPAGAAQLARVSTSPIRARLAELRDGLAASGAAGRGTAGADRRRHRAGGDRRAGLRSGRPPAPESARSSTPGRTQVEQALARAARGAPAWDATPADDARRDAGARGRPLRARTAPS